MNSIRLMIAFCCINMALLLGQEAQTENKEPSEPIDIKNQVVAFNRTAAAPGTKWAAGHVSIREFDSKAITETENGFTIQLPSGAPVPSPTIYKDKLFVGGGFHSKEFYCFDASTGALIWGVNVDDDGPSSAVVEEDVVVFNTESCTIFALDANTGKMLWSWWLGDPLMTTPTIKNGRVYTSYPRGSGQQNTNGYGNNVQQNSDKSSVTPLQPPQGKSGSTMDKPKTESPAIWHTHVLACFDLKTGKVLWQKWIDSDVMSAPVAVDDELYIGTFAGTTYKFDGKTGEILSAIRNRITSAPVVSGTDMFCTFRSDSGTAVRESIGWNGRADFGLKRATNDKMASYLDSKVQQNADYAGEGIQLDIGNGFSGGAPASANAQAALDNVGQGNVSTLQAFQGSRVLLMGDNNYNTMGNEVVCTNPKTGKILWSRELEGDLNKHGGFLGTSPAAAGGDIFIATLSGKVMQIEVKSGEIKKSYDTGAPVRFQPVIENGRIYVGTQTGKVVCIDTKNPALTGWPMWGGNAAHTGTVK